MSTIRPKKLSGAVALVCALGAQNSFAQLEEITVTATKRGDVDIQDIASSISAFGEKKLDKLDALEFAEFARHVPSLMFVSDGGPGLGNQQISLRGLNPDRTGGAGTVAEYMDGAPRFGNTNRLFDMQQVEVLRGPQGTLYGASSLGGTIRYLTNAPVMDEFGGSLSVDMSDTDRADGKTHTVEAAVNIPLVDDTLAARIAVLHLDEAGFINNITTGQDGVNNGKTTSIRGSLLWTPIDELDIRLTYYSDDLDYKSSTAFMPALPQRLSRDSFFDEPAKQDYDLFTLNWNYDLGWAILSGSSAEYENNGLITFDINTELAADGLPLSREDNVIAEESTTHEIRLVSQSDSPWQWIVGFYHDKFENSTQSTLLGFANPNLPGDPAPFTANRTGVPAGRAFETVEEVIGSSNTKETAFFGELSYAFNDQWTALVGARTFKFEQVDNTSLFDHFDQIGTDTWDPFEAPRPAGASKNNDQFFKVNVQYRPNEDALIYATAAEGFRQGGFNRYAGTGTIPLSRSQFEPDTIVNYEIGANTTWLDNHVTLNVAVYFVDWKSVQTEINSNLNRRERFTVNDGAAESKGIELSLATQDLWVEGLSIDFAWGHTNAEYTKTLFNTDGSLIVAAGDKMPRVPKNTYSLDVGYERPIFNGDLTGFIRGNYSHADRALDGLRPADPAAVAAGTVAPVFVTDSQNIINLSAGVEAEEWTARVYMNNVTNKLPLSFMQASEGFAQPTLAGTYTPRTLGVKVDYNF